MTTASTSKASTRRKSTVSLLTDFPTSGGVLPPLAGLGAARHALDFVREANSPFQDGYSIEGEKAALADLLAIDEPSESDPRYPRLEQLEVRERQLRSMQASWTARQGAEPVVTGQEASSLNRLGSLVDEHADSMTLHTKEGYRMFVGRARDPAGQIAQIVGGKHVASALKSLWMLTGADNPYADWALCRWEESLSMLNGELNQQIAKATAGLEAMKHRGLRYSVLMSQEPKALTLGFKSPYGYGIAELVVSYDYFIRVAKTLHYKGLQDDGQTRQTIREVTRAIRRTFAELARFERYLIRPELQQLARADFVPGAAPDALKRVEAATAIYGSVPPEIFACRLVPGYSRRRQQLTQQERNLLETVSRELAQAEEGRLGAAPDESEAAALL